MSDILMIVLHVVLSGIEDWTGMDEFGEDKETSLHEFLNLPNGIPSHDTLSDVQGRIYSHAFQGVFCVELKRHCRAYRANKSV
ncbi:MAG: transposase family protein [Methylobacter sp.]